MSVWAVPKDSPVRLPPEFRAAGMGRRVGAFLLDGLLSSFLMWIPMIIVLATGAVTFNQQALDQLRQVSPDSPDPWAGVTAPMLNVNIGLLIAAALVYLVLRAIYFAGCWIQFGGTPCQRGLGLWVVDVGSGRNLSIARAVLRWVLLAGLADCVNVVFFIVVFNRIATTPMNEWAHAGYYGSGAQFGFSGAYLLLSLASWSISLWQIILLISAGTDAARRGIHDKMVGSVVIERAQPAPAAWPGYPPQAWPGYPPQAWPGYPPQAWPGYPPQAGQPAAPTPPGERPADGTPHP